LQFAYEFRVHTLAILCFVTNLLSVLNT